MPRAKDQCVKDKKIIRENLTNEQDKKIQTSISGNQMK
jgi:hypothetical protein